MENQSDLGPDLEGPDLYVKNIYVKDLNFTICENGHKSSTVFEWSSIMRYMF